MDSGRARRLTGGLFCVGVVVLWLTVDRRLPPFAGLAALAFFAAAARARTVALDRAETPLVRGVAVALGLLVVAVAVEPLSGVRLPDIGVLGPYTYLATEVAFGTAALALLLRAGRDAVRRAGRTIVAVYPLAYVWDWYTLEVGVFEIPLRTGVEFVGVPLEEHLFMLVVPALVLAVHETLTERTEATQRSSESD